MKRSTAIYVGNDRVLVRTASGHKMYVDSRDVSIAPHIMLDGVWEEHVEAALRKLVKPGMHVIEIGANVGFFTLQFARLVGATGSVRAFEPDPGLAAILRDNAEINGYHATVTVEERAIGDTIGSASFFTRDRHRGNGTLLDAIDQVPWNASDTNVPIEVAVTTLDAYLAAGVPRPHIVKIDAEGAEAAVFRGASRLLGDGLPLVVIAEFVPDFFRATGQDPARFIDEIERAGFTTELIDERRRKIVAIDRAALLARRYSELLLTRGKIDARR